MILSRRADTPHDVARSDGLSAPSSESNDGAVLEKDVSELTTRIAQRMLAAGVDGDAGGDGIGTGDPGKIFRDVDKF